MTPVRPQPACRRARPTRARRAAGGDRRGARRAARARAAAGRPAAAAERAAVSNTSEAEFLAMVEGRRNISRRRHFPGRVVAALLRAASTCPPSRSTARCGGSIPSPFLCYLDFGGFQIVCSSPEILVRAREGKVTIRPIAGTRWRGKTARARTSARRRTARRPEGARRTSDAARSRPQRRRPRRRRSARSRSPTILHRALQPRHAHRLECRRRARSAGTT